ncbi:MAG: hypothetical protein WCH05_08305 [Chlorobiaceae bacterium]
MRSNNHRRGALIALLLALQLSASEAYGWHDRTHLAIAKAAGFSRWYSAAAADVVKSRAQFRAVEEKNHYFNNNEGVPVTARMVLEQAGRFNEPDDAQGHLYGAIIGSLRDFRQQIATGKYADYPLVYLSHYVGDLSMPLHNTPYDAFNRERHSKNDGIIEEEALENVDLIRSRLYPVTINSEEDLAREISRVANIARTLGLLIRAEKRDMTSDEAYTQAVHSASLLRGVLIFAGSKPVN